MTQFNSTLYLHSCITPRAEFRFLKVYTHTIYMLENTSTNRICETRATTCFSGQYLKFKDVQELTSDHHASMELPTFFSHFRDNEFRERLAGWLHAHPEGR